MEIPNMTEAFRKLLALARSTSLGYSNLKNEEILSTLTSPNWDDPSTLSWTDYVANDLRTIWDELSDEGRLVVLISADDCMERALVDREWQDSDRL
jgi:hypothetical protein